MTQPTSTSPAPDAPNVLTGVSISMDALTAAKELYDSIFQPDISLCLFYCSPEYDLAQLGSELHRLFGDINIIGCTTAGEITPTGYLQGALTGVSFASETFQVVTQRIDEIDNFAIADGVNITHALSNSLVRLGAKPPSGENTFAFLLIDGLCGREEVVVSSLHRGIGSIQLFGGSAGDNENLSETFLFHDGEFRSNCALLSLIQTDLPFTVFKTQHFVDSDTKMVITEADPGKRIVTEINGVPAGREYARMVGLEVNKLTPMIFAAYPVVVKIGGEYFVRSLGKVNEDGSLLFFCAIDEGVVLTVAEGKDMVENLGDAFQQVRACVGEPILTLGCDCLFRRLEMEQKGLQGDIAHIMMENKVIGFSTYGEQYNAMHVNQTFTGVAIGRK